MFQHRVEGRPDSLLSLKSGEQCAIILISNVLGCQIRSRRMFLLGVKGIPHSLLSLDIEVNCIRKS